MSSLFFPGSPCSPGNAIVTSIWGCILPGCVSFPLLAQRGPEGLPSILKKYPPTPTMGEMLTLTKVLGDSTLKIRLITELSRTILILLEWQLCTHGPIPSFWVLNLDTAANMVPVQEPATRQIPAAWHCQALPLCEKNQLLVCNIWKKQFLSSQQHPA